MRPGAHVIADAGRLVVRLIEPMPISSASPARAPGFLMYGNSAVYRGLTRGNAAAVAPRLAVFGGGAGLLAGFFGIGGGFLVVPGPVAGARIPLLAAIGSSLVSVFAFGLTTATNYALSGLIDWRLVIMFVLGGIAGSLFGGRIAARLASQKRTLSIVFAVIVAGVGVYGVVRGLVG